MLDRLHRDAGFRSKLSENAARTAQKYNWEASGRQLSVICQAILQRKEHAMEHKFAQGPTT
jgi:hypothetical protein